VAAQRNLACCGADSERSQQDRADEDERDADGEKVETWGKVHDAVLPQVEVAGFYQEIGPSQAIKLLHRRTKNPNEFKWSAKGQNNWKAFS
jgi:hypothetical protein